MYQKANNDAFIFVGAIRERNEAGNNKKRSYI